MLAAASYTLEAAFVRHFKNKLTSPYEDVIEAVCKGEDGAWETVKTWCTRVRNALCHVDPQCRLRFSTTIRDRLVVKKIDPK